jgi:hypothetical protein
MKKKYVVEFTMQDGSTELITLNTDRIEWSIDQWKRNRAVTSHSIVSEGSDNSKQMLFG